jgi:uncharacterized protein (TIGR01777 family)
LKLVISGASGFIASALSNRLLSAGHKLVLLTSSPPRDSSSAEKRWLHWTPGVQGVWERALEGVDGIINLAGEPLAALRWSARRKRKILQSRIDSTRSLVTAIGKITAKPKFLINASAIGYYGTHGDETLTEESAPGRDFLASVCSQWEQEAIKAVPLGCRVVLLRSGIVLGRGGGALAKMVGPFKFFVGGPVGSGKQWMSWIHIEDEVELIRFLIENDNAHGPINATAPNPVTNGEFCRTLGQVMKRPSWLGAPAPALQLLLGEMATILLNGQKVLPAAAQKLGYAFKHPSLRETLQDCLK